MTTESDHTLLVIAGPTAVGKTDFSIRTAKTLETEIVSADSRQFYREMNIGVARPSPDQLAQVRHHFIGHASVQEPYDVSRFEQEALALLEKLFEKHPVVILTGGSGMYIDAVCKGMDELPAADPEIRKSLYDGYEKYGIRYLQNRLLELDPGYHARVDLGNHRRLIRALEVCIATGVPYSSFRTETVRPRSFRIRWYGLTVPQEELYDRINRRTDRMIADGLEQEAGSLYAYRHLNALNTVGYREMFDYFDGKCTFEQSVEKIKTNTRRYARRQMTWFRRNPEMVWIHPASSIQIGETHRR